MPDVRVCPLTVWAWRLGALAPADLWQRYIDLGGSVGPGELADYLGGRPSGRRASTTFWRRRSTSGCGGWGCPAWRPFGQLLVHSSGRPPAAGRCGWSLVALRFAVSRYAVLGRPVGARRLCKVLGVSVWPGRVAGCAEGERHLGGAELAVGNAVELNSDLAGRLAVGRYG
jgi:hypothetical protein